MPGRMPSCSRWCRTLDGMDEVINLLSERVAEWHQVRHPAFSRKYRRTPAQVLVKGISRNGRGALGKVAVQVEQLAAARTELAKEVSARANQVMPNTSALIGGLVAARLMSRAGGSSLSPGSRRVPSRCSVPGLLSLPTCGHSPPRPSTGSSSSTGGCIMRLASSGARSPGCLPGNLRLLPVSIISGELLCRSFLNRHRPRSIPPGRAGCDEHRGR